MPGQAPLSVFTGNQPDDSPPGAKAMAKDDVNALASNLLAPFSLFLAAHSLHPPDHPPLSLICSFLESA